MRTWIDFWNSAPAIYVNERHKRVHAEAAGRDILRQIASADAVVLDHGCGEALYAENVAARCARLVLCEAAPTIRAGLAQRLAGVSNIEVIDPGGVERLPDASLDLVVANSLVQYLTREELESLLDLWRRKLKPNGAIVVADVVPPDVSPLQDSAALLRFAWHGGFLAGALAGLLRTAISDYGKLRQQLGFSMYTEAAFLSLLSRHGYKAERVHPNFGHNQARMTFWARPL